MSNEIVIAIISSGAMAGIVSLVNGLITRRLENRDVMKAGMMTILFDRLRFLGNAYIKDGIIDFDDRRNIHKMHTVYHKLGGNGDLDVLIKQVDALPLKQ